VTEILPFQESGRAPNRLRQWLVFSNMQVFFCRGVVDRSFSNRVFGPRARSISAFVATT
jgi:hypothetical protein